MQQGSNEICMPLFQKYTFEKRSNIKNIFWVIIATFCLLLSGCATKPSYQKDGPPPFDVDVSRIPNAVPKAEPRAKYGNMPVYHVKGRDYCVMKSAKHFEERGIASWYGMRFHKQRTSSGEPYNCLAMTAAHKTLPLPTYVEVTNLKNNRKVIVKVNDRGPFASNRIIDLSYVAAKKLGMLGHGTTYVDIKAIDPNEAFSQRSLWAHNTKHHSHIHVASAHTKHSKTVYLQVGVFKNRMYAEKLRNRLHQITSSPIEITHHASNKLYRVNIGPIRDVATADSIKKKLRARGLEAKHIHV